jgi:Epoxide hydrolase N terminus
VEVIMSVKSPSPDRRKVLGASAAVAASSLILRHAHAATTRDAISPFQINFPKEQLVDLRRRIAMTRWPEQEAVTDDSQGVPLAMMQELAHYWGTDYDWRKCEAKLNGLPNFITEIDGLDIHFIHVRSKHENAWLEKETVTDASRGVQLATMKEVARYWATGHDWRKIEARLNASPQFMTEIDGLDIQFHSRSFET